MPGQEDQGKSSWEHICITHIIAYHSALYEPQFPLLLKKKSSYFRKGSTGRMLCNESEKGSEQGLPWWSSD